MTIARDGAAQVEFDPELLSQFADDPRLHASVALQQRLPMGQNPNWITFSHPAR